MRNAAAEATAVLTSPGSGEMLGSIALASPIGMMMSAVAVLLMSWPSRAVSRNRPAKSA